MLQPQLMPFILSDHDGGHDNALFYLHAKLPSPGHTMDGIPKSPHIPPALDTSSSVLNGSVIHPSPTKMSPQEPVTSSPPGRASTDPPLTTQTPTSASALQVPGQLHRRSSPARYSHPPSSAATHLGDGASKPTAPPLQHRHTLEVPRVSTSRVSQDHQSPTQSDFTALPNGRTSQTSPRERRRPSLTLARRITKSLHSDQFLDDVPQDEDSSRWAETIRQKRAARRRRKEEEDDDRVVVGTKVDQHHVNYVTAYNMLTGIRFTVSRTNAKIRKGELTDAHFAAAHKFSFDV